MAVIIRDLYFGYFKETVLKGLKMNVNEANIYALLGPSGCGKTTLLEIIIGLRKAKRGEVFVYGYSTNSKESGIPGAGVGYMPQEIGLQFDLTIAEIMHYFGSLQMMTSSEINREMKWLTKKFHLVDANRLIGSLSGGQKRLVSLSITLLHKPRLLILDEPTVGCDPLLRNVIWNHLNELRNEENVTTIVTTHYVEEAKRSNVVAFMRNGQILSEAEPNLFLNVYNARTLNDVFLTLCEQQEQSMQFRHLVAEINSCCERNAFKPRKQINELQHFLRVTKGLVIKNFTESRRNPLAIYGMFCFSFVTIMAMTVVFGGTPVGLNVAWVNENKYNIREWIEKIEEQFSYNVTSGFDLSNIFRNSLNKKIINLIEFGNFTAAMHSLAELDVRGVIHLKTNFSESFVLCDVSMNANFENDCESEATLKSAMITLITDTSNPILSDTLRLTTAFSIQKFRREVAKLLNISTKVVEPPIAIEVLSGDAVTEDEFNLNLFTAAGFLIIAPFGFSAGMCILSTVAAKECDMSLRSFVSGVKSYHKILAEVIAKFIILSVSALINLLATIYVFGIPNRGSFTLVLLLSEMQVLMGISVGILLSSLFSKSAISFIFCVAMIVGTLLTTGAIWSVESQPVVCQIVNALLPFSHSIKSMRSLLLKQGATFHPQISMGFIMTTVFTILHIVFSLISFNLKNLFNSFGF